MRLIKMLVVTSLAIAMASCAKVPQAAVDAAKAALDAAVKAEAPVYAADAFAKADGLVKSMDADIAAKSYKNVASLAAQAADAAKQAAEAAVAGKAQVQADVAKMVPEVEKGLKDADARIKQVATVRGIKLDIPQLKAQLEAGRKSLEDAKADATAARFMDSRNKLQAIRDALAAAAKAIDEAMKARK